MTHANAPLTAVGPAPHDKAARRGASPSRGYAFLHHAFDSHSRLAYSEQLDDERKETAAAFWERARAFFADAGNHRQRGDDRQRCLLPIPRLRSRPRRRRQTPPDPALSATDHRQVRTVQPNPGPSGPTPRPTSQTPPAQRPTPTGSTPTNHHRPHTGIAGLTPAQRVHNVTGNYT